MGRDDESSVRTTMCGVEVQFLVTESEHYSIPTDSGGYDELFEDMFSEMNEGDVLFEVGAHIGIISCVVGRHYLDIDIVCFEPNPQTRELLETNLELNDLDAIVMDCAVSNSDGTMILDTRHGFRGGMKEARRAGEGSEIPVRTLDGVVTGDGVPLPTVIVADIVGDELNLLRGGSTVFSLPTTRLVYLVTHDQPLERLGKSTEDIEKLLRKYGFDKVERLRENLLKAKKSGHSE